MNDAGIGRDHGTMAAGRKVANVLSIAGTDPSGGAGIQADLKTFAACGVYGMAVTTAIVAQNTCGVRRVQVLAADLVSDQLQAVLDDVQVDALKIGMLGHAAVIRRVARILRRQPVPVVVLDPVLCSSSGRALLEPEALKVLQQELLPLVTVLTPNLAEAEALLGRGMVADAAGMMTAARELLKSGPDWVWLKGGHRPDGRCADVLVNARGAGWLESPRVTGRYGHGTGCTLSSALAAELTRHPVPVAAERAKRFLYQALVHASWLEVGQGSGPLHHGPAGQAGGPAFALQWQDWPDALPAT